MGGAGLRLLSCAAGFLSDFTPAWGFVPIRRTSSAEWLDRPNHNTRPAANLLSAQIPYASPPPGAAPSLASTSIILVT